MATASSNRNQTLVLVKPDGISKSLTGNVLTRLSEAKLEIAAAKCLRVSRELALEHYRDLKDKPFFDDLISYILGKYHTRKKVLAMVYEGEDAIQRVRKIVGATNPEEADVVSIRGAFGRITTKGVFENVIHASANEKEAEREIKLWFQPDEIIFNLYPSKKIKEMVTRRTWA